MDNKKFAKGVLCAAAGGIGWGISGVCGQFLFIEYDLNSSWITAVRMILSGIILLGVSLPGRKSEIFGVLKNKTDRRWLILFAIFGLLLCQYAYLAAIKFSNSGTATVLQSLNVVIMAVVMAIWTRSKMNGRQVTAIALAVAGTYLIATNGSFSGMVISVPGLIWGLLSAAGVVSYTLLSQTIIEKWGNIVITGWGMLIGGAVLGLVTGVWNIPDNLDLMAWLVIGIIVVIGTAGGFSLFLEGVKYIGPVKGTLIGCLEPATATVLSAICLGTKFGAVEITGFCAILATVFLSVKAK